MRHNILRPAVILCIIVILGSLVLRLVATPLCLSARSVAGCQRCCQPETSSETEARVPTCSLFCCSGLPGVPAAPAPPTLSLAVTLPGLQDLSACLAPVPPPPRFS
jgi:hypothetical protein